MNQGPESGGSRVSQNGCFAIGRRIYSAWAKESATCLHNIAGGVADSFAHALVSCI